MVHSSTLTVTTDGEHLTCAGFSLGETIRFGRLEFIANYFGNLSLSLMGNESGVIFVGMARSGSPPLCSILEDSINEFYIASSREGNFDFPVSWRRNMVTLPFYITATPRLKDASTLQAIATVPLWTIIPRLVIRLHPE
jgi:hypothetical protein